MKNTKLSESDFLTIVAINDAIASIRDKATLFEIIFNKLEPIFNINFAAVMLYDNLKTQLEVRSWSVYGAMPTNNDELDIVAVSEIPFPLRDYDITLVDVSDIGKVRFVMSEDVDAAIKAGIKKVVICPLQSGGKTLGYLTMTTTDVESVSETKLDFLKQLSNPIAAAVSNITAYEELLQRDHEKELQIKFINSLVGIQNRDEMCYTLVSEMNKVALFQYVGIIIEGKGEIQKSFHNFIANPQGTLTIYNPKREIDEQNLSSLTKSNFSETPDRFSDEEIEKLITRSDFFSELNDKIKINSFFYSANDIDGNKLTIVLINLNGEAPKRELNHLSATKGVIELAFKNLFAFEENELLRRQLEQEKNILLDEIHVSGGSNEIIGTSHVIKKVYKQINQVSKTDTTVLIQGETGVGKEVIAKTLHGLSNRKERVLITVNCAALPAQLIESELFGHERGSFTGALEKKIGKFELANGGTIFLDEIGELPLDLQSKLLRVLQEKEFERIGGKEVHHTDVRIIAATNRDLQKEIAAGHFRPDLFFRLNVFPILIPPLRERLEDIPLFIKHFTEKYSKRVGVPNRSIRADDMSMLLQYNWPGNIRELEHIVERAVITSTGAYLEFVNFSPIQKIADENDEESFKTMQDMERDHIIAALRITNGRVSGDKGACKLLGLNSKTLDSRMKKFGIKKEIIIR